MYLATRGAGHSHSHSHGEWNDPDDQYNKIEGSGHGSQGSRVHDRHSGNASRDDAEVTESLVSGVSPLPSSIPTLMSSNSGGKLGQHFTDEDSDYDVDEMDDPLATEVQASASGSHDFGSELDIQDVPESVLAEQRRRFLQCVLLEAGILFHSIFIGMAISVATGPAFVVFLIAISFHQCFEGLALGSRIAALHFPKRSPQPWLMVLAFGATTPIGQAIGLLVHGLYDPQSQTGLLMVGVMNAISAGLLLFAGLVQLLAEDFLSEKSYETLNGTRRRNAYIAVVAGAMLMSLVGAFA
ncbi:zip family zinc transporter [Ceratocystis lukuohia]|uniref:Zinc-regulated transporter 2 n=2 Tax=Ceratocystis TaxID=5157 RepID=A0A0F8B0F3_CERFI|nr:Zinc-regulated transporter 2 [Ceratocystis platani]